MLRSFLVASILATLAAPALADGPPGTCDCAVPAPAPLHAPPRFGVGLHASSLALHPRGDTATTPTQLGGGGVQVRFRFAPRWELQLALDHLTGRDASTAALDLATLDLRFHLSPYRRWDGYLFAGAGTARDPGADPSVRPTGQAELGAGLERRFHHLGLSAELRAFTMAPPSAAAAKMATATPTTTPPPPQTVGGGLDLAATWYF